MRIIGRLYKLIVPPHPSFAISARGNISANAGAPDTFPVKGRLWFRRSHADGSED